MLAERLPKVKTHRLPQEFTILHHHAALQPEVADTVLERIAGRLVPHQGHARITWQNTHGKKDDAHRPEEHGHRQQQAPHDILKHRRVSLL